jgi:hypothetical protein
MLFWGLDLLARSQMRMDASMDLSKRLPHAVAPNGLKTMVDIAAKDAPASPGTPDELRLVNRLYLAPKLATSRLPRSGDAPERGGRPCISEEAA